MADFGTLAQSITHWWPLRASHLERSPLQADFSNLAWECPCPGGACWQLDPGLPPGGQLKQLSYESCGDKIFAPPCGQFEQLIRGVPVVVDVLQFVQLFLDGCY